MADVKQFLMSIFSEDNSTPPQGSSSRVLSFILSVGCLGVLAILFHHLPYLPLDKLALIVPSLPIIIGALTAFCTSPYAVNRIAGCFDKGQPTNVQPSTPTAAPPSALPPTS